MVKPKAFRPCNPEQTLLLPPSSVDWLPENHLVFFLPDLAAELDLDAIHAVYRQKDPRGEKAYEPRMARVRALGVNPWGPQPRHSPPRPRAHSATMKPQEDARYEEGPFPLSADRAVILARIESLRDQLDQELTRE